MHCEEESTRTYPLCPLTAWVAHHCLSQLQHCPFILVLCPLNILLMLTLCRTQCVRGRWHWRWQFINWWWDFFQLIIQFGSFFFQLLVLWPHQGWWEALWSSLRLFQLGSHIIVLITTTPITLLNLENCGKCWSDDHGLLFLADARPNHQLYVLGQDSLTPWARMLFIC